MYGFLGAILAHVVWDIVCFSLPPFVGMLLGIFPCWSKSSYYDRAEAKRKKIEWEIKEFDATVKRKKKYYGDMQNKDQKDLVDASEMSAMLLKELIESGGNANQALTTDGRTPLHMASQNGNVDIVKVLIKAGGNVNQTDNYERTPLFIACTEGHIDIVRLFLQQPNIDSLSITTTLILCECLTKTPINHTEIIQLLNDAKANDE